MTTKQTKTLIYILAATVVIFYAFYFLITPLGVDDYSFLLALKDFSTDDHGTVNLWEGLKDSVILRYYIDNIRIAQILLPSILYFIPHWLTALISASAIALIFICYKKLSPEVFSRFTFFTLFMLLFILAIPWHDSMFYITYQLNYIWPAALMIVSLWIFSGERRSPVLTFFICLLTGLWHEAFGIALIGASLALLVVRRQLRADIIAGTIAAIAAVTLLGLVPGTSVRAGWCLYPIWTNFVFHPTGVAYLLLWLWMLCSSKWRGIASESRFVIFAGAIAAGIALNIIITYHRVGFPAYLISTIALPALLSQLFKKQSCKKSVFIPCTLVWLFLIVHLSAAAIDFWKINRADARLIEDAITAEPSQTIFSDIMLPHETSILSLRKATSNYYYSGTFVDHLGRYYNHERAHTVILPPYFKSYHGQGEPVPGNSGLKYWHGFLISSDDNLNRIRKHPALTARFRFMSTQVETGFFRRFITEDGHQWWTTYILRPGADYWGSDTPAITIDD